MGEIWGREARDAAHQSLHHDQRAALLPNPNPNPAQAALLELSCPGAAATALRQVLYLPYISPISPLHLPCISPASPLYLPCISQASAPALERDAAQHMRAALATLEPPPPGTAEI